MKRTLVQRIRRQVRILLVMIRDWLYMQKEPYWEDDDDEPTGGCA
jgi:hypothetical protein